MARKHLARVLGVAAICLLAGPLSPAQEIDNPSFDPGANSVPMQQQNSSAAKAARKSASAVAPVSASPASASQAPRASQEGVDSQALTPVRGWIVALLLACVAWTVVYARTELFQHRRLKK